MANARLFLPLLAVLAVLVACTPAQPPPAVQASTRYVCPMHPDQTADHPAECPICGMDLVPDTAPAAAQANPAPAPSGPGKYHCPMHPDYVADRPGECPICGMDLVPMVAEEITLSLPGQAEVRISPERQQLIGVQRERVARQPLERVLRAPGRVDYDERRVDHVHTRTEGWIRKVYANYTGQMVKAHQALFTFYSPELEAAQAEYLLALRGVMALGDNPIEEVAEGAAALLSASRSRLLQWEFGEEQLAELEKAGAPLSEVSIYTHSGGFVVEKQALEGMRAEPGADLYTIADLGVVWIHADLYEHELALVHEGQEAVVSLSYYPGQVFRGKVVFVYPYIETQTRTGRARIEFANPDWQLKPGMFTQVEIETAGREGLVVPASAVLDSGARRLVFVDRGEGRFEPRQVELGGRSGEGYEVLSGLTEGEQVITSANFLIDSESQLKAALSAMGNHQH